MLKGVVEQNVYTMKEKSNIVLKFEGKGSYDDYAILSLFLKKLSQKDVIDEKCLDRIQYCLTKEPIDYLFLKKFSNRLSSDTIDMQKESSSMIFRDIKDRNEFNRKIIKDYNISFLLLFYCNKETELLDFQYLFLIKQFYPEWNIKSIIISEMSKPQEMTAFYHRLSHFFIAQNSKGETGLSIYDDIFFYRRDASKLQRLQINNPGRIAGMLPLMSINENQLLFLSKKVETFFTEEDFRLLGDQQKPSDKYEMKDSCKKLLYNALKQVDGRVNAHVWDICSKMTVLGFLLFCYSLKEYVIPFRNLREDILVNNLNAYSLQLSAYAHGLQQLIENIVHHTRKGSGCLTFLMHKEYASEKKLSKYGKTKECSLYLEVSVTNYSGQENDGNLADNFIKQLPKKYIGLFRDMKPQDFFVDRSYRDDQDLRQQKIYESWQEYYSDTENIGKHYGLQIFSGIIGDSRGLFVVRSFSNHSVSSGSFYPEAEGKAAYDVVIPGTQYNILLPLKAFHHTLDAGIDKGINNFVDIQNEKTIYQYIDEKSIEYNDNVNLCYSTQEEKYNKINMLIHNIEESLQTRNHILRINMKETGDETGELISKAIINVFYRLRGNCKSIVLYNCSNTVLDTLKHLFQTFFDNSYSTNNFITDSECQIAAFPEGDINSIVFIPSSFNKTLWINNELSKLRGVVSSLNEWNASDDKWKDCGVPIIPFEVIGVDKNNLTLFEIYTKKILETNIQGYGLGCKIKDTHMRLGSAVHIDTFYEAELLFCNKLFITRFAFLLLKDIKRIIKEKKAEDCSLTLYGYAAYSELLIFEIQNALNMDVNYVLLEREMERRGLEHVDRIRYNIPYESVEEKRRDYKDRKFIVIVPVNSTLKTHNKMLQKFYEDNGISLMDGEKNNILASFSLISVGPEEQSLYWQRIQTTRILKPRQDNIPESYYYLYVITEYENATECHMCFPENPLDEKPLIEVNASSTIPDQSFELMLKDYKETNLLEYEHIKDAEAEIEALKPVTIYDHVQRGENHFSFYIETEKLLILQKDDIIYQLEQYCKQFLSLQVDDYHIIFCPMHFSNAGFVELVNSKVFNGAALVLRIDIDKEYRSNLKAKYSHIQTFLKNLSDAAEQSKNKKYCLKVSYVDDMIISARTFYRAKSLLQTLFMQEEYESVQIRIFDSIFLLVNRNSSSTMKQFLNQWNEEKTKVFTYIDLRVSSLRNHGNSCVNCNLSYYASVLHHSASTNFMYHYWEQKNNRMKVRPLEEAKEERRKRLLDPKNKKKDHTRERLACAHIIGRCIYRGAALYDKEEALISILRLLSVDLQNRNENGKEYFFSYLKTLSRPFVSFNKAIKEAVFELLLNLLNYMLSDEDQRNNAYSLSNEASSEFLQLVNVLENQRIFYDMDLLQILMSQLTELKSNYILRPEVMNNVWRFVKNHKENPSEREFQMFYIKLIKRLTGINSDTSKSVWLAKALYKIPFGTQKYESVPDSFKELVVIENTRVFYDALLKLNASCKINLPRQFQRKGMQLKSAEEFDDPESGKKYLKKMAEHWNEESVLNELMDYMPSNETFENLFDKFGRYLNAYYNEKVKQNNDTDLLEKVGVFINNQLATEPFLYDNFCRALDIYGYICPKNSNEDYRLNEKGIRFTVNLLFLFKYIDNVFENLDYTDRNIVEIYRKLAFLMREVLFSNTVYIVLEDECERNAWKNELMGIKETEFRLLTFHETDKKDKRTDVPDIVLQRITLYQQDREVKQYDYEERNGYLLFQNEEDVCFIWEIARFNEHSIYIYADFPREEKNMKLLNRIACLMMLNDHLKTKVFTQNANTYLYEIVREEIELRIRNRSKASTHTKEDERKTYYERTKNERIKDCDTVLYLLSDLVISNLYCQSFSREFYEKQWRIRFFSWSDFKHLLDIPCLRGPGTSNTIKLCDTLPDGIGGMLENDSMIEPDDLLWSTNDISHLSGILMAFIKNADKSAVTNDKKEISVYLTKTKDGDIRILNQINSNFKEQPINILLRHLKRPPQNDKDGISIWSVSQYIKSVSIDCLRKRRPDDFNKAYEELIYDKNLCIDDFCLEQYNKCKMTIKIEILQFESKKYFSIRLPLFKEKISCINGK